MTQTPERIDFLRRRAAFACEYCGVTETDSGGLLTVDHHHPQAHGGADDLDNLIYCCFRCNVNKADYWPATPEHPRLWNPRREPRALHLDLIEDGTAVARTPTGEFTLKLLRLNRPQLVAHRLYKLKLAVLLRLLDQQEEQMKEQLAGQKQEQANLEEEKALLQALLRQL